MEKIEMIWEKGSQTKRLYLRKLKMEDINDMFEYTSNEETCFYLKWEAHKEISQTEKFIITNLFSKPVNDILWGIESKTEKKLIGVIRMYNINFEKSSIEVSYILNDKYGGNGYMTEALLKCQEIIKEIVEIKNIYAYFVRENTASEKVMQRCGMKKDIDFSAKDIIKGKPVILNRYVKKIER